MKRALLLCALLATAACGRLDTYRYPLARPSGRVATAPPEVFMEGQLPSAGMQELAMVEAVGYGNKRDMGTVIRALQEEAMRFDANAIVRVRVDCGYGSCHAWGVAVRLIR